QAPVLVKVCTNGDLPRSRGHARPKADLVSLALCRGPDDRRGDQRPRIPGHRRLRQAGVEGAGLAAAARGAMEIRLQVDQVDRALQLHRSAAEELLGGLAS